MTAPGLVFSSKGSAQARSWSCPAVSIKAYGLPNASASAWILVLGPPRDRPMAGAPFFSRASAVLVSAHNGGIDHHVFVVMIFSQQLENTIEDPALRPPAEPLVDRFPMAKPLREVAPGTSRSKS